MVTIEELQQQLAAERGEYGKEMEVQKKETVKRKLKKQLKHLKRRKIRRVVKGTKRVARGIVKVVKTVSPKKKTWKKFGGYMAQVRRNIEAIEVERKQEAVKRKQKVKKQKAPKGGGRNWYDPTI